MIQKEELTQITYAEFGDILANLTAQVQASGMRFDLIVPILRSGAVTATHLAAGLRVVTMLPAQYKYMYEPCTHVVKLFNMPNLLTELPSRPNILVVDTNTVHGGIAKKVIADVKARYPESAVYFASACLDASLTHFDHVEQLFYGCLSNESRKLSQEEAAKRNISQTIRLFPWENFDEEWEAISAA